MYTLLDTCLDKLDIFQFLNYVEEGLKDHYDIKVDLGIVVPIRSFHDDTRNELIKLEVMLIIKS